MENIFVDTSALFALLNTTEPNNIHAWEQWNDLIQSDSNLITTNYIVVESIALIQNRLGLQAVECLTKELLPLVEVSWVGEEQHNVALEYFFESYRRNLSLVDCSSFEAMRRLDIQTVFTFDDHFREQGFKVIP